MFVIKGNTAKDFLKASIPLESIPALGALKEHMQIEAGDMSLLNFLIAGTVMESPRFCPLLN